MTSINPYEILCLNKDATQEEIKTAYKKLALKYHPDKNGGNDEMFKQINNAYQILIDPVKRKIYDMHSSEINYDAITQFATSIFTIIQQEMSKKTKPKATTSMSIPDIKINVSIDLEEIYNGNVKKIVVKINKNGVYKSIPLYIPLINYEIENIFKECGDEQNNCKGDIIVYFKVISNKFTNISVDEIFTRFDLHMEEVMTLYEYYYGISKTIKYFNDEILNINVKPLDMYFVHEIKDKGLPFLDDDENIKRGSLHIHFKLKLPLLSNQILEENKLFFINFFKDKYDDNQ